MDKIAKNLEEDKGFVKVRSSLDNLEYKVLDYGTESEKKEVAYLLSKVRRDLNTLLMYLCKNPQLWINLPIAYGIIHTFDIHVPCLKYLFDELIESDNPSELINKECLKNRNLFNIQEMTPNKYGIIGLNKPKVIKKVKMIKNGKEVDYEIAEKRSIHLTIRNEKTGKINDYDKILNLAIHEITHTTCNDLYWKPDNHKHPYPSYHRLMIEWAKEVEIK